MHTMRSERDRERGTYRGRRKNQCQSNEPFLPTYSSESQRLRHTMHHFRCIFIRQTSHYSILGSVNGYAVAPPFTTAMPFSLPCRTRSPHTMHHSNEIKGLRVKYHALHFLLRHHCPPLYLH